MNNWADFVALEDHIWSRLGCAVARSDDPWRYVTLATQGTAGPQVRLVGLRGADRTAGTVEVHTDTRTPKVAQIRQDPRTQLLFWDPVRQEQVRLSTEMHIVVADPDRWARVPDAGRQNYGTDPAPGTGIDAPEAYDRLAEQHRLTALVGRITGIDAVCLASDPHRRAQWAGTWRWVAP